MPGIRVLFRLIENLPEHPGHAHAGKSQVAGASFRIICLCDFHRSDFTNDCILRTGTVELDDNRETSKVCSAARHSMDGSHPPSHCFFGSDVLQVYTFVDLKLGIDRRDHIVKSAFDSDMCVRFDDAWHDPSIRCVNNGVPIRNSDIRGRAESLNFSFADQD